MSTTNAPHGPLVALTLVPGNIFQRNRRSIFWLGAAGLLAAIVAAVWLLTGSTDRAIRYQTAVAQLGQLIVNVSATGTLQPVNQVEVGAELSGVIRTVNVDFNDRVKTGQVLASLDADRLSAQVVQSEAAVESAKARIFQAETTVEETRLDLQRAQGMVAQHIISEQEATAIEAKYKRAQAEEVVARADLSRASAALNADRINLAKAVIRTPISGIVLTRNVEPGQTVVAALQAPVLFVVAEDLTRMELRVDVDEADVGHVLAGQRATFTVDAYPDRTFEGQVTMVRFASQTVGGVVTYKALLSVDNSALELRPGMTATANIVVNTVQGAVLVPNAALRFTPPAKNGGTSGGFLQSLVPRPPGPSKVATSEAKGSERTVWMLRDGSPAAVPIKTGATDGRLTQVTEGAVHPGDALLVDVAESRK